LGIQRSGQIVIYYSTAAPAGQYPEAKMNTLSNRLPILQEQITDLHRDVLNHTASAAEKALAAGAALVEAKAICGHGAWGVFLADAGIPERTAQRYMKLHRAGMKSATVADLGGIAAAERFLADHRPKNGLPWQPDAAAQVWLKIRAGEEKTLQGWLAFGAALNEARGLCDSDKEFDDWMTGNGLSRVGKRKVTRAERDAAMWAAGSPEQFETARAVVERGLMQ
jgi:hypothetical protein